MSTTTTNLGLFKYDIKEDGILTFNIERALNNNWDILDEVISTAPTIEVDSALSTESENPVQNKVITNALSNTMTRVTSVGNASRPIYVNSSGNLTACTSSLGDYRTPVYMSNGQFYTCSYSIPTSSGGDLSATLGSNYIKFSNNFLLQWGVTTFSSTAYTQNLAVSYSNTNYSVQLTEITKTTDTAGVDVTSAMRPDQKYVSSFYISYAKHGGVCWMTAGV